MARAKPRVRHSKTTPSLFQIRISLEGADPAIWRRLIVRADTPLHRLHRIFQVAMGWSDSHMHQFMQERVRYGVPDPTFDDRAHHLLNERLYTLADLVHQPGDSFVYVYDLGDDWLHRVELEAVLPADPALRVPVCLAGAQSCPPEDCGGIFGYQRLREALSDPKDPQRAEIRRWVGTGFDPSAFDPEAVNRRLRRLVR